MLGEGDGRIGVLKRKALYTWNASCPDIHRQIRSHTQVRTERRFTPIHQTGSYNDLSEYLDDRLISFTIDGSAVLDSKRQKAQFTLSAVAGWRRSTTVHLRLGADSVQSPCLTVWRMPCRIRMALIDVTVQFCGGQVSLAELTRMAVQTLAIALKRSKEVGFRRFGKSSNHMSPSTAPVSLVLTSQVH